MTELFQAMGQMDNMTIGLWITGLMLVLVILGLRVAFAAAVAGFLGLVWIFSAKLGFEKGFIVAAKMAGTIPHSKVSSVALSLIPTFILIGFLAYHAGLTKALFKRLSAGWVGCPVVWELRRFSQQLALLPYQVLQLRPQLCLRA